MTTYRWNVTEYATGYDAAADAIHPHYLEMQGLIERLTREATGGEGWIVDLGGGSGRLMERMLDSSPDWNAVIIDQSEAFLALAERRLARFGERVRLVASSLQNPWEKSLSTAPSALVSMSAIHHLEADQKRTLYRRCWEVLLPGGVFLNGDEVRPAADDDYLARLQQWAAQMRAGLESAEIPAVMRGALEGWIERNVTRFGTPKQSGDDCHETIWHQLNYMRTAGFSAVDCPWECEMWAMMRGVKSG